MGSRTVLVLVSAALVAVLVCANNVAAQPDKMQNFFSAEYAGVSIRVDASTEILPAQNITMIVMINATADGVRIEHFGVGVYGFINGRQQTVLSLTAFMADAPLQYNETTSFSNTVIVPADVWGMTYGQISLRYAIKDLPSTERNPGFPLTAVRNIYLENLESQLQRLNQSHNMLSEVFKKLTMEYMKLDALYIGLSDLRPLDSNDLYGTRTVAAILTITTVFFVATTLYLAMRKPKDYW